MAEMALVWDGRMSVCRLLVLLLLISTSSGHTNTTGPYSVMEGEAVYNHTDLHSIGRTTSGTRQGASATGQGASATVQTTFRSGPTTSGVGQTSSGTRQPTSGAKHITKGAGQATSGTGQSTSGAEQTLGGARQSTYDTRQRINNAGQSTNNAGQDKNGTGQTTSGAGQTSPDPRRPTSGTNQITKGAGQTTSATGQSPFRSGQSTIGARQSTNGTEHMTSGGEQNTKDNAKSRVRRVSNGQVQIQVAGSPTHLCQGSSCWNRCGLPQGTLLDCGCDNSCYIQGNCCIDYEWECDAAAWRPNAYNLDSLLNRRMGFLDTSMSPYSESVKVKVYSKGPGLSYLKLGYPWVYLCPDTTDEQLRGQCEQPEQFNVSILIGQIPVLGNDSIIYKNKFCALCHGETRQNLIAILTDYTCNSTTYQELLRHSTTISNDQLLQKITDECSPFADLSRTSELIISPLTCNSSYKDSFERYDADEAACLAYTNTVVLQSDDRIYKNEHCVRCSVPGMQEGTINSYCAESISLYGSIEYGSYTTHLQLLYDVTVPTEHVTVYLEGAPICSSLFQKSYYHNVCVQNQCSSPSIEDQQTCLVKKSSSKRWSTNSGVNEKRYTVMFRVIEADDPDDTLSDITLRFINAMMSQEELSMGEISNCLIDQRYMTSTEGASLYQKPCIMVQLSSQGGFVSVIDAIKYLSDTFGLINWKNGKLEMTLSNFDVSPNWDLCPKGSKSRVQDGVHMVETIQAASFDDEAAVFSFNDENVEDSLLLIAPGSDFLYSLANLPIIVTTRTAVPVTSKGLIIPNIHMKAVVCASQEVSITHSQMKAFLLQELCDLFGNFDDFTTVFTLVGNCLTGVSLLATWLSLLRKRHCQPVLTACVVSFVVALLMARLGFQVSGYIQLGSMLCRAITLTRLYFSLAACLWLNVIVVELFQSHPGSTKQMGGASRRIGLYLGYGWGTGVVVVGICLGVQLLEGVQVPDTVECGCWISPTMILPLCYAVPAALTLVIDFALLLKNHNHVKKDFVNNPSNYYTGNFRSLYFVVMILVLLVGIDTGVGFLVDVNKGEVLWYTHSVSNLVLSLYVFVTFGIWMAKVAKIMKPDRTVAGSTDSEKD